MTGSLKITVQIYSPDESLVLGLYKENLHLARNALVTLNIYNSGIEHARGRKEKKPVVKLKEKVKLISCLSVPLVLVAVKYHD